MTAQVLYRKWRPQTLAEVVGQQQVTQTLLNALGSQRVSHAYLFCGPRGTGKTSTGRILSKAVNCLTNDGKGEPCNTCAICQAITDGSAIDVIEIDAASNTGVDDIRSLREKVNYAPNQARYKVYIIDEVHMLSNSASNALLKTLEEPPPQVIFILATTESHKVLPTIMSRCQRFDFRRIAQADVVDKLTHICSTEGIQIEPEALRLIARATTGSLRDAENLLQQLTTYYGTDIGLQQAQNLLGITGDWRAKELVRNIIDNEVSAGITTINSVNNDGLDLRQFNRELVEYLRLLMLIKTGSDEAIDLTTEDTVEIKELATRASLPQLLKAVKLFSSLDNGFNNYSTLPLELALVECTLPPEEKENEPVSQVKTKEDNKETIPSTIPTPKQQPANPEPVKQAVEPVKQPNKTETALIKQQEANEIAPSSPVQPEPAVQSEATETEPANSLEPEPETRDTDKQLEKTGTTDEIARLVTNWRQFIKDAPDGLGRTPAAALLRSAKPKTMEADTLVLSFKFPLHKENMEKIENQKMAEQIISHFLGRSCRVRCVCEKEDNHLVEAVLKMGAQIIGTEEK